MWFKVSVDLLSMEMTNLGRIYIEQMQSENSLWSLPPPNLNYNLNLMKTPLEAALLSCSLSLWLSFSVNDPLSCLYQLKVQVHHHMQYEFAFQINWWQRSEKFFVCLVPYRFTRVVRMNTSFKAIFSPSRLLFVGVFVMCERSLRPGNNGAKQSTYTVAPLRVHLHRAKANAKAKISFNRCHQSVLIAH